MKKKLLALVFVASVVLTGCKDKVYEDQRMGDSNKREVKMEYNMYTRNIADSGYNWYSTYINDFVTPLKDSEYKVDPAAVKEQIKKVEMKRSEIEHINADHAKKALDIISDDLSIKEKNDKKFKKEIEKSKEDIEKNKKTMDNMLISIENALKLGLDGSYSTEDLSKIKDTQVNLIKTYDEKLLNNN